MTRAAGLKKNESSHKSKDQNSNQESTKAPTKMEKKNSTDHARIQLWFWNQDSPKTGTRPSEIQQLKLKEQQESQ